MNNNAQIIETFYSAFQRKDYKIMQDLYSDSARFSDPVFTDLNAQQVRAMWEMLVERGKDMELTFKNITAEADTATADWAAVYTFSASGNKVLNNIHAKFVLKDGKIVEHVDYFPFYTWAKQALGTPGKLLGWTSFMHKKVQKKAMEGLLGFMAKNEGV